MLKAEVNEKTAKIAELEAVLEESSSLVNVSTQTNDVVHSVPMVPQNIEEFKEYLAYNLEAFGVRSGKSLLPNHLTNVLFKGQPTIPPPRLQSSLQ